MPNDVLRRALVDAKLTPAGLASRLSVDPETVQRWVADEGRTPQPRHRWAVADALGVDEMALWPNAARALLKTGPDREIQAVYPTRMAIPTELYRRMVDAAHREIALCAYSYTMSGVKHAEHSGAPSPARSCSTSVRKRCSAARSAASACLRSVISANEQTTAESSVAPL